MTSFLRTVALPFLSVLLAAAAGLANAQAPAPGRPIGFSIAVNTDGFFSTTVQKVVVTNVVAESQAQASGLVVGDELVKVQGLVVPGNSATVLKPELEFMPGVPKKLVFKHGNGTEFEVTFTRAVAK
jgi:ABC-type sugar transport system substrate-binding protein